MWSYSLSISRWRISRENARSMTSSSTDLCVSLEVVFSWPNVSSPVSLEILVCCSVAILVSKGISGMSFSEIARRIAREHQVTLDIEIEIWHWNQGDWEFTWLSGSIPPHKSVMYSRFELQRGTGKNFHALAASFAFRLGSWFSIFRCYSNAQILNIELLKITRWAVDDSSRQMRKITSWNTGAWIWNRVCLLETSIWEAEAPMLEDVIILVKK